MKYLVVIFAALALSLLWLGERYKTNAKAREAAAAHQPAPSPAVKPSVSAPHLPAQEQKPTIGKLPQSQEAANDGAAETSRTAPNTPAAGIPPLNAPVPAATATPAAAPSTETAAANPAEAAAKQDKLEKDWPKLCYNASMLADRAMRRHQDGATPAELTNIGTLADADLRDRMQGVMNQVASMPRSSDFAQQQLMLDNIKSSTYNDCMESHR